MEQHRTKFPTHKFLPADNPAKFIQAFVAYEAGDYKNHHIFEYRFAQGEPQIIEFDASQSFLDTLKDRERKGLTLIAADDPRKKKIGVVVQETGEYLTIPEKLFREHMTISRDEFKTLPFYEG